MSLLPSFLSREPQIHDSFLGVDIGTTSAKVAVFALGENGVSLLGLGEEDYEGSDSRVALYKSPKVISVALQVALEKAGQGLGKLPKETIVGLSGEAVLGFSTQVRLNRGQASNSPITEAEMKQLYARTDQTSWEEAQSIYLAEKGHGKVHFDIIGSKINHIAVGEATVFEPLGKTGASVRITQFSSFAISEYLSAVQSVLSNVGLKFVTAVSNSASEAEALVPGSLNEFNAILIDIGGFSTEIGLIYGRNLTYLRSFSLGSSSINTALLSACDLTYAEAEAMKREMVIDPTRKTEGCPLKQVAANVANMWSNGVAILLEECRQVRVFPSRVLLSGGGSLLPQFKEALITNSWTRGLPFESFPKVEVLETKDLKGISLTSGTIKGNSGLGVISLGLVGLQIKDKV